MLQRFYPDRIVDSTYKINFEELYNKGKRGILFDIDNTLVEHGADSNEDAEKLFRHLHALGFRTCLISNNNEERVTRFNKNIQTDYIYKAGKPNKKGYLKAMDLMGVTIRETVFIGDQIFTDIYGAKCLGIDNIYVKQIAKAEEIQIVLKRHLEKIVLRSYEKSKNR